MEIWSNMWNTDVKSLVIIIRGQKTETCILIYFCISIFQQKQMHLTVDLIILFHG